jgi:hypothetical protein
MERTLPPLEELRRWLRYEPETGEFFWVQRLGKKITPGKRAGWTQRGYRQIRLRGKNFMAHRLAWIFFHEQDPGHKMIDHINGNGLDNRIANLRLASPAENGWNRPGRSAGSSQLKGVHWYERKQKWRATIGWYGTEKYLGYFDTEQEAHEAYRRAAARLHGEFARYK